MTAEETIGPFDTGRSSISYKTPSSVDSVGSPQTNKVTSARIDSVPPTFIDTDPDSKIQGGKYCVRGTRVPVVAIKEAVRDGHSYREIAKSLKQHFGVRISPEDVKSAVKEYDNQTIQKSQ